MLFFLPIIVMSIAYALIIGRLWGTKPPGEKMDAALSNQARAKRKVSSFPSPFSPWTFPSSTKEKVQQNDCLRQIYRSVIRRRRTLRRFNAIITCAFQS